MPNLDARWTPKVHPLSREVEPEDPMELVAEPVVGDPAVMLECILQEFLWLGAGADELEALFSNPGYPVLYQLREYFGPDEVRRQIDALLARTGRLRFRETIAESDEEEEKQLVQLMLPDQHGE